MSTAFSLSISLSLVRHFYQKIVQKSGKLSFFDFLRVVGICAVNFQDIRCVCVCVREREREWERVETKRRKKKRKRYIKRLKKEENSRETYIKTVIITIKMPTFPQLWGFGKERQITGVNSSIKNSIRKFGFINIYYIRTLSCGCLGFGDWSFELSLAILSCCCCCNCCCRWCLWWWWWSKLAWSWWSDDADAFLLLLRGDSGSNWLWSALLDERVFTPDPESVLSPPDFELPWI